MKASITKLLLALLALGAVSTSTLSAATNPPTTNFFSPQVYVGDAGDGYKVYYLDYFKYYAYPPDTTEYIYKFNFGFLYYFNGNSSISSDEAYFYDFTSRDYFYTSAGLYPYIYSFNRKTFLYYFENSNPREFYDFSSSSFVYF